MQDLSTICRTWVFYRF